MTARIDARFRARLSRKLTVLLSLALAVVLTHAGPAQAQSLKFFNNFFLPGGDFFVAGVGLEGAGDGTGLATDTIFLGPDDPGGVPDTAPSSTARWPATTRPR